LLFANDLKLADKFVYGEEEGERRHREGEARVGEELGYGSLRLKTGL